jgi:hypothetical protein
MKKRAAVLVMLFALLATLLPVTVYAAPEKGVWVLEKIEDQEARDYETTDDPFYQGWIDYTYERGVFGFDWRTKWDEYNADTGEYDTFNSSGSVSAVYTGLPERVLPGETVTVSARLSSSATTDYPVLAETETQFCYANINVSGNAENIGAYNNQYAIPDDTYTTPFEDAPSVSFTLPESTYDETAWVQVNLNVPNDTQTMMTTYNYRYIPAQTPVNGPSLIELGGLVRSVENKPMPWMKLQAQVYYDTETYSGAQPDLVVDGMTDYLGRYRLKIPLKEGDLKPVGIMLVGTLECRYPHEENKTAYFFVDMADAFSVSNNLTSVGTWLTVKPAEEANAAQPEEPIRLNRLLAFYHLGLGAWSFDGALTPDPVYYFSSGDQVQVLQDLSYLYTLAYDAWFFGAATLGEAQALLAKPVRIEARWTPPAVDDRSNYTASDNAIHLEVGDSKRDDNSRYVILHEFGHAFDAMTLANGSFRCGTGYAPGDTNHGGYLNGSTSDSTLEGFATCFAALTQLYSGYPNPGDLVKIKLQTTTPYHIAWWGEDGCGEELAIASFLYETHSLVADTAAYWALLKPDLINFKGYYDAIMQALPAEAAQTLKDYAYQAGLYTMPFGNSQYDLGEPFRDLKDAVGQKNGVRDPHEPFADLMFAVDPNTNKFIPYEPIQTIEGVDMKIGLVGSAGLTRQTIAETVDESLTLSGAVPEYVLVDIAADGGTSRNLLATENGGVCLSLPELPATGTVTVSVPGGGVIYTGDLASLQAARDSHPGLPVPLDSAVISEDDLAPEGTLVVAAYGDSDASGVLEPTQMSDDELADAAQNYDPTAETGSAGPGSGDSEGYGGWNSDGGDVIVTPEPDMDQGFFATGLGAIVLIAIIVVILAVLIVVVVVIVRRGKNRGPGAGPYSGRPNAPMNPMPPYGAPPNRVPPYGAPPTAAPRYAAPPKAPPPKAPPLYGRPKPPPQEICPVCGAPAEPGSEFCQRCGKPLPDEAYCPSCGAPAAPGSEFCQRCGKPLPW